MSRNGESAGPTENQEESIVNISNCRVIIADDSILKAMDIRRALEWNGIRDITIVSDQEK